jgi:hypothetical protein
MKRKDMNGSPGRKPAVKPRAPQGRKPAADANGDGPSDAELEMFVSTLDKIMSAKATRSAWLMGFLVGSALVEQDLT